MDNQTKIIFFLLGIILILGIILGLKISGIIKPAPIETPTNIVEENEISNYDYTVNYQREESLLESIIYFMAIHYVLIVIVFSTISIIINIGIGKLYRKLSMPEWTVKYQYMYPVITIISSLLFSAINSIITLVLGIISIVVMSHYFRSVGMSKYWPLLGPAVALPIIGLSISLSLSGGLFGASNSSTFGATLLLIVAAAMIITYLVACIIANVRVGKAFNKGILFQIGIAILPSIFQPILGYWGEVTYATKHNY